MSVEYTGRAKIRVVLNGFNKLVEVYLFLEFLLENMVAFSPSPSPSRQGREAGSVTPAKRGQISVRF